jgi:hypothetical protein
VPHYPLIDNTSHIGQSFRRGRTLFLLLDQRSHKSGVGGSEPRRMLGAEQQRWFNETLQLASIDATIDVVFWVSGVPFIDDDVQRDSDTWAGCDEERRALASLVHSFESLRGRVFMLSGDIHATAFDDGSNNHYHGDATTNGFAVFHAAAIDKIPTVKGGPYSHGCLTNFNQYGWVRLYYTSSSSSSSTSQTNFGKRNDFCVEFNGVSDGETRLWFDSCRPEISVAGSLDCSTNFFNILHLAAAWAITLVVTMCCLFVAVCIVFKKNRKQ